MAWIFEVLEIADAQGYPTGKFRKTRTSDEDGGGPWACCDCEGGHDTPEEAENCPHAFGPMKG